MSSDDIRRADPRIDLIDRWQRDLPLVPRPYAALGREVDLTEGEVLALLAELLAEEIIGRVGAVVRPNTAGASTLAAVAAPPDRLEEVAAIIDAEPCVNHNYQREHRYNLWFVVAAPDRQALAATLQRIGSQTGLAVLDLPLEHAYHIDLGFPLTTGPEKRSSCAAPPPPPQGEADAQDRRLLAAMENGLPLAPRPFLQLGLLLGWSEAQVISRLSALIQCGVVTRLGCVVRHRMLGYTANAMIVWNVPDEHVDEVAQRIAGHQAVNLCYRRPRRGADWPYNLFAMIHGRARDAVVCAADDVTRLAGLHGAPRAVLFSKRCFKQRGARFSALSGAA